MANLEYLSVLLGRNIYWRRIRKRLTQEDLSRLAKIPRSTLCKIESGKSNPSLQNLIVIAEALNASLDELIAPKKHAVAVYRSFDSFNVSQMGKVRVSNLLPDKLSTLELKYGEIEYDTLFSRKPRQPNSREFVTVLEGKMNIWVDDLPSALASGQSAYFRCDQPVKFENTGTTTAKFIILALPLALI